MWYGKTKWSKQSNRMKLCAFQIQIWLALWLFDFDFKHNNDWHIWEHFVCFTVWDEAQTTKSVKKTNHYIHNTHNNSQNDKRADPQNIHTRASWENKRYHMYCASKKAEFPLHNVRPKSSFFPNHFSWTNIILLSIMKHMRIKFFFISLCVPFFVCLLLLVLILLHTHKINNTCASNGCNAIRHDVIFIRN